MQQDQRVQQAASQYVKMTETPIPKLVISLAIPTVLSMLITSLYNMVDTAFVGTLGNSASGAVGVIFGYMAILQAFAFMFGQGSGSLISRNLGRHDVERSSVIASTGFFLAMGCGGVIGIFSFLFMDPLVVLLGSSPTIAPYAKEYLLYILMAAPFMTSSIVLNNVLRYEGKAVLGMVGLVTGAVLNIFLDAVCIFLLDMGIGGAGFATAISQTVSFCILLSMFVSKRTQCALSIRLFRWDWSLILDIVSTGSPSFLRQGLNSGSTVLLNSIVRGYGDAAVAAMSIVNRICMFIFSVTVGIGQGYQPVSGFNYGAGKYSRVRQGFRFTFKVSQALLSTAAIVIFFIAQPLVGWLRNDPMVVEIGVRALRLQCAALFFMPFCVVTEMQLQSTGQRLMSALLAAIRNGLFFIPALVILHHFRGLAGVQEAQPLSYVLSFFVAVGFSAHFFRNLPKTDEPE